LLARPYHLPLVVSCDLSIVELATRIETSFLETFGVIIQVLALQDRNYNDLPLTDMKLGLLLKNDDKVYVVLHGSNLRTVGSVRRLTVPSSPASPTSPLSPTSPTSPSSPSSPLAGPPFGLDSGLQTYFRLRSNIDNAPSGLPEADLIFQRFAAINDALKKKRSLRETESRETDSIRPDFSSLPASRKELLVKLGRSMTVDIAKLMDNSSRGHAFSPVTKLSGLAKKRKVEEIESTRKENLET